jgi:hypothetical protein
VHLAYYNMCEFCTMIPISLFITKIQKFEVGLQDFLEGIVYAESNGNNQHTRLYNIFHPVFKSNSWNVRRAL